MSKPLHERIRRDVERRILSGKLAPGERLPTEHGFMVAYGCARMTVNKALSALVDAGLLVRRKKAGTFVARPDAHSMMLDIPDLEREVRGRGERYRFVVLSQHERRARTREERALAEDAMVLRVKGVHHADDHAFALEDRLINLAAAPRAAGMDWGLQSPGAWLLDQVPWTEAENRVLATNVDVTTAKLLDLRPGQACLVVERKTWRGRDRITSVRQSFAPGAIDLVARFGPMRARA